jgi:hypothetical protein
MRDTRFGENNNQERLQLLFRQMVMGMPGDQQAIETFDRFTKEKGESWARAQLSAMRDGYPTVLEDGEGKEYVVSFGMCMGGSLTVHAASPQEALELFRTVEPERLAVECCFDDCVTVDGITDEDEREYLLEDREDGEQGDVEEEDDEEKQEDVEQGEDDR